MLKNLFMLLTVPKQRIVNLLALFLLFASLNALADKSFLYCDDDQQAAKATFQRIENEWPLRDRNDEVTQYVQNLGVQLAQLASRKKKSFWKFSVVRDLAPNAFSIGDGYIFITDGAISFAQNESEIAAILAHELGHELAGHFCKASTSDDFLSNLFDIFVTSKTQQHQASVSLLKQTIDPVKEQEADQAALLIMQAGGYDLRAMLDLAYRLPSNKFVHFSDATRIEALKKAIDFLPPVQVQKTSDKFLAIKKILTTQ